MHTLVALGKIRRRLSEVGDCAVSHSPSAHQLFTWSRRAALAAGPLALLMLLAWLFGWIPDARPFAVLMVYQALLLVTVAAAAVALLAGSHLAIHQAFSAGLRTGEEAGRIAAAERRPRRRRRRGEDDPLLQLVDGDDGP